MAVCGVDIRASEAILALAVNTEDGPIHAESTVSKLKLSDERNAADLATMKTAIEAFAHENAVTSFAIKSRKSSGVMASGGVTFKIEALFQLSGVNVKFVSPQALANLAKKNAGGVPSSLFAYQHDAFRAAVHATIEAD